MTFEDLRSRKDQILQVVQKHGGKPQVLVFGSVARGEASPGSDLDLLVELEPGRSLLDRVSLQEELGQLIGCRVDAVSPQGLYWAIREQILSEAVPL